MNRDRASILLLSCLLCLTTGPILAETGTLPDVLIQAEEKRPVKREKPVLNLDLKEGAPLETVLKTEDELRLKVPSEIAQSTHFVTGISNSPHAIIPASHRIALPENGEPVRMFHPYEELQKVHKDPNPKAARSKARWELVIADSSGKAFKKYDGEGLPPKDLEFDGRSADGKWLQVGQVYSGVLTYKNSAGRSYTVVHRPFTLAGLAHQELGGFIISLAPGDLFVPDREFRELSSYGTEMLHEASQIIQRYHPGLTIEVQSYLNRSDKASARRAAESCARELAGRLFLSDETIVVKAFPGTPDIEERIDLKIHNR